MRKNFPGFYLPSDTEFEKLWAEGIFIFDTNVLLDLYRYSDEAVENLITTMNKIKSRIWIPHRIAFEYHRRLNDIIKEQAAEYTEAIKILISFNKKFEAKRSHPFLHNDLHHEIELFTKRFDVELKNKQKMIQELILQNPTKEKLADIIDSSIGTPFTDDELKEIYTEGAKRYSEKIPPGYKDKGQKQGNEIYGDLIIWKEICRKAKEIDKPIILVTGDVKEDWFQIVLGQTVGPRPELVNEIKEHKDILFYIYPTDVFLRRAKDDLKIEIKDETLNEIEEVIKESRKNQEKADSQNDFIEAEVDEDESEFNNGLGDSNYSVPQNLGEITEQDDNNSF